MIERDVPLSPLTTIELGGVAQYFVECTTHEQVRRALLHAATEGLAVHILGGGSNTIFSDDGFHGLVLRVNLRGVEFNVASDLVMARVASGENWDGFVRQCVDAGYVGLEALSGIPGFVGATPMQNVGAYGQEVAQTIVSVKALDRDTLAVVEFSNEECGFQYRGSRFKYDDRDRYVILEVTYKLQVGGAPTVAYDQVAEVVGDNPSVTAVREAVLGLRKQKSMVIDAGDSNTKSCGSFFLNPIVSDDQLESLRQQVAEEVRVFPEGGGSKLSAAWLIEKAGYKKGEVRGGVGISDNHVLALVNRGGTTKELLAFAEEIQAAVYKQFGIELVREPIVV